MNGKIQKFQHPTIKPLKQIEVMIKSTTNRDDMILDIFSGSGTTSVSAKILGRSSIALEKDENYIKLIRKRLREHGS